MKSKVLIGIISLGFIYLFYSISGGCGGDPLSTNAKMLQYSAEWFQEKNVNKIVSTEFFSNKLEVVFNELEIEIYKEDPPEVQPSERPLNQTFPEEGEEQIEINVDLIDLKFPLSIAKSSSSKGIYIKGEFLANGGNVKLLQEFIDGKGYIYFSSPNNFYNMSQEFIDFIKKSLAAGSITIMDFEKMNHTSGSTAASNLKYIFHYDSSNANKLIETLNKRLAADNAIKNKEKETPY